MFSQSSIYRSFLLLILILCVTTPAFSYSGGSGTAQDPYQIATKADLLQLAATTADYSKCFVMTADISLVSIEEPLNYSGKALIARDTDSSTPEFQGTAFTGIFDGNGHKVTGLVINGNDFLGLFGQVGPNGVIRRVMVDRCVIVGSSVSMYVGGLVGWTNCATIEDCGSSGTISGGSRVGGLVGRHYLSTMIRCWSTAKVTGSSIFTGGLVGVNSTDSAINLCYATGNATGSSYVGGLVGNTGGTIANSCASGAASMTTEGWYVGGLAGINSGGITKCYSTGLVTGVPSNNSSGAGGLVGYAGGGTTTDSFWDTQTSGQSSSSGGTGKTTLEMQYISTFTSAGWDFVGEIINGTDDYWQISTGKYPTLVCGAEVPMYPYSGGSGTATDPYHIATKEDLLHLGATTSDYGKCFIMTMDVDLTGGTFLTAIIAPDADARTAEFQGTAFTGIFDGNGYKVTGLMIKGNDFLGLFGQVGPGGVVRRVTVENCSITNSANPYWPSPTYVGGLVGWTNGATIEDCGSSGTISGVSRVGGLVGRHYLSTMTRCWSSANVSGRDVHTGGLAGVNSTGSTISLCYAMGNVTGYSYVGGLVGNTGGTISNSYATGAESVTIQGWRVGGLAGINSGSITKCYSSGSVTGSPNKASNAGGLVGYDNGGTVIDSLWDTQTSGLSDSAGGTGKTTLEMQDIGTFTSAGWDFVGETINGNDDYWQISAGTYPTFFSAAGIPRFVPDGGTYNNAQNVVVTCWTSGTTIRYTTDGADPNESDRIIGSGGSLVVDHSLTLKAKAWKTGYAASGVHAATYTMIVSGPTFDPPEGGLKLPQDVVITCATDTATIHYTTNGLEPTESDPIVASGGSVFVEHDLTLKARAWKAGFATSSVTSAYYVVVPAYPYSGGSGTPADPYQLATKEDLLAIAPRLYDYVACFVMTADIDLTGETFTAALIAPDVNTPVADYQGTMFYGTFDGNGHTISNITIDAGASSNDFLGLFGCISETAIVKNLGVERVSITGTTGSDVCGGIVGWNKGTILGCHSRGTFSGHIAVGGLVGRNNPGSITLCYSTVTVTGSTSNVGGLVGANAGTVTDSYATGSATGGVNVGGLVGVSSGGGISRCYAAGRVLGGYVGGLVGTSSSTTTNRSFWDRQTSGQSSSAGGAGVTTSLMQTISTFTDAGWDFAGETANGTNDYWQMLDGTYPIFSYQSVSGGVVAVPIFSPSGGAYDIEKNVVIICATAGATIHYTTNGVDPTESDDVLTSGSRVYVDHSLTLKAKAWKMDMTASAVMSSTYTIQVAAPAFSMAAGTYNSPQNVVITCATGGAMIHYTTNGADPMESDPFIASGASVLVDHNLTLKARAWKGTLMLSEVRSAYYTIVVATPAFVPDAGLYNIEQNVVITCATPGATIHYTTNNADPAESDPVVASGGSVWVDRSLTLKAKAWKGIMTPSTTKSADYAIIVVAPSFTPIAGEYYSELSVTITCSTPGAVIHYTMNGTAPTQSDTVIPAGGTVSVDHSLTLKARAWRGAMTPSEITSGTYTIMPSTGPSNITAWGMYTGTLPFGNDFTAIAAGLVHGLALRADGSIVAWGDDTYGQATPPPGTGFRAIAGGAFHSLALRSDGGITAWGNNDSGQCNVPSGTSFTAVASGYWHSLALKADGSIMAWGDNTYGQATPPDGNNFVAISAGGYHNLALRADGNIVGWGSNYDENNRYCGQATPPSGTGFTAIAAGGWHSLALRLDGSIAAWGSNDLGRCNMPSGTGFAAISAGLWHSLALRADGSIVGWGDNSSGEATPPSGTGFVAIAAGDSYSLALRVAFSADLTVVAKRRVGRTTFDYDCKVVLKNNSSQNIRVTQFQLESVQASMSIVDSSVSDFGDVGAGESVTSADTCTFRVDRFKVINAAQVKWQVTYEVIETGQTMQLSSMSELRLEAKAAGDIVVDGMVDYADLMLLSEQWLSSSGDRSADIAPDGGDGIVNFADFAALAANWMQ